MREVTVAMITITPKQNRDVPIFALAESVLAMGNSLRSRGKRYLFNL